MPKINIYLDDVRGLTGKDTDREDGLWETNSMLWQVVRSVPECMVTSS